MGEGNDFVDVLIRPATERLLEIEEGRRVLDLACGNGLAARRLASLGANVIACDFSAELIRLARRRTPDELSDRIEWHTLDATDADALLRLGEDSFDSVLCNMALFDIADIEPVAGVVPRLLRSGGTFVCSVIHPCFNNPSVRHVAEQKDNGGTIVTEYGLALSGYRSAKAADQTGIPGQPVPHVVFHRSLQDLLGPFLRNGLMIDALEERAFPPDHPAGTNQLGWNGNFSEFPPVLVMRFRTP